MKRQINFSWPAILSFNEEAHENERFSRGKLKVFYEGETADKRYFPSKFSKELVKSLPYTPIVSYYDEEKDDFVGHATEQSIYGIVDPCGKIEFVKEDDGNTWIHCDTVYYTERPDKVGDIAKKIEGHSQSLELDPKTVEYTVNYDEKKHFKNVEFTAGHFIGVSVLGKDQKPAFTGSEFFSCDGAAEKFKLLRDYCEGQNGGKPMNLKEFMVLSWGDISSKVSDAVYKEYEEEFFVMPVDFFDDCVIVRMWSYVDGSCSLNRIKYSCDENGVITLGEVNEVHIVYEDIIKPSIQAAEEQGVTETKITEASCPVCGDPNCPGCEPKEDKKDDKTEATAKEEKEKDNPDETECGCGDDKEKQTKCEVEPSVEPVSTTEELNDGTDFVDAAEETVSNVAAEQAVSDGNAETDPVTTTEGKVENETEQTEDNSGSTSFTESERAELEALKREKKITLVDSYKESLTDEEYSNFVSIIDEKSDEELELELLRAYKRNNKTTKVRAFSFMPVKTKNEQEDSLNEQVRYYLHK